MTEWQVGQRLVHRFAKWCGIGVVRYIEKNMAIIRWANGDVDLYGPQMPQHFSAAPDFPRVYREDDGRVFWVWLDNERGAWLFNGDDIGGCVPHDNGSLGQPDIDGSWSHHEITGTPEADRLIKQAEEFFAKKAKPAPAPLPTAEEVVRKVLDDRYGFVPCAEITTNFKAVSELIASAIRLRDQQHEGRGR